jgi:two-component system CheB/CheR fusion protein
VYLPRADSAAPEEPIEPAAPDARGSPRRILIIEDNADAREALRLGLQVAGHEVHEASDGPEGIESAARVKPDVVLLDIGLPGLDGFQVAQRLRDTTKTLRLIAISGYGQAADRDRATSAGFDHYLVKPIDPAELARLLT